MTEELNDFVIETTKEVKIDGKVWKIKPVTAGDENSWLSEYIEKTIIKDEEGNEREVYVQNHSKLNECQLRNIVDVPYSKETIEKVLGRNLTVGWIKLSVSDRKEFLLKLKPGIFNKVIKAIKN